MKPQTFFSLFFEKLTLSAKLLLQIVLFPYKTFFF